MPPRDRLLMGGEAESIGVAEARSVLAWWLEAGVDVAVQETPRDWLKPISAPARKVQAPEQAPSSNVSELSADTLVDLQQWLASSVQLPLASATAKRIMPHGPENAAVMLLSDAPALEDFAAGQPIGGEAWVLAGRMLAAIGIGSAEAYSASLSCFNTPGSRMADADRAACAEIAHSHIRLVRPERLILFGDGPCLALLGKRLVEARGHIHKVE